MNSVTKLFSYVLIFTLLANLFVGFSLVIYVASHDYLMVELSDLGDDLETSGLMHSSFVTAITGVLSQFETLPTYLDVIFLGSFVFFVVSLLYAAYQTPREGYLSVFGGLTIGVMVVLFIFSYFIEVSEWLRELFFNLVPSLTLSLPVFNWYMDNAGIIGMVLIILCILLNFIDLDLQRFNSRKDKEVINDEI